MVKKSHASGLYGYLKNLAASGQFDSSFSSAITLNNKNLVYSSIRTARSTNDDPDDVLQYLIIGLWKGMQGFYDNHYMVDGDIYTLQSKDESGYYLRFNRQVSFFSIDQVSPTTEKIYYNIFFKKIKQICSDYYTHSSRIKRGMSFDHVYLYDQVSNADESFYLEELMESPLDSPEDSYSFAEMKQLLKDSLSEPAQVYFEAVGVHPPGPIEGWVKPLKLYKKELLQARAELYRAYASEYLGCCSEVHTDEIFKGIKDSAGPVNHRPVHVSAGALQR